MTPELFLGHTLLVSVIVSLTQVAFTRQAFYLFFLFPFSHFQSSCAILRHHCDVMHEQCLRHSGDTKLLIHENGRKEKGKMLVE